MDEYKVGDKVYIKIKENASSYRACKTYYREGKIQYITEKYIIVDNIVFDKSNYYCYDEKTDTRYTLEDEKEYLETKESWLCEKLEYLIEEYMSIERNSFELKQICKKLGIKYDFIKNDFKFYKYRNQRLEK